MCAYMYMYVYTSLSLSLYIYIYIHTYNIECRSGAARLLPRASRSAFRGTLLDVCAPSPEIRVILLLNRQSTSMKPTNASNSNKPTHNSQTICV